MYGTTPTQREPTTGYPQPRNSRTDLRPDDGIFPDMIPILTTLTALALPALTPPADAMWPLDPRPQVVRGFELPAKPWMPGHRGVDLAGSPGQPVRAATAGTITYAGPLAGRGVITVATGSRRTTYEPVVPAVTVGATVTPGTVIGHLSAAGSHCAPATCLHWGLVQGKQYLNPLTLLPNRPVRLLPLTPATNNHQATPADPSPLKRAVTAPPTVHAPPATQRTAAPPDAVHAASSAQRTAAAPRAVHAASSTRRTAAAPRAVQAGSRGEEATAGAWAAARATSHTEPITALLPAAHATPHAERATAPSAPSPADSRAATVVVVTTAALTLLAGLMIRRH